MKIEVYQEVKPYARSLAQQKGLLERVKRGGLGEIIVQQHHPVVTYGSDFKPCDRKIPDSELQDRGIQVFYNVGRRGKETFHGNGQIVAYWIDKVPDLLKHIAGLENWIIDYCRANGIQGESTKNPQHPGVLIGDGENKRKIAAVGIGYEETEGGYAVWHGLALNVMTDLHYFDLIHACGDSSAQITSMQRELDQYFDMRTALQEFAQHVTLERAVR